VEGESEKLCHSLLSDRRPGDWYYAEWHQPVGMIACGRRSLIDREQHSYDIDAEGSAGQAQAEYGAFLTFVEHGSAPTKKLL
jgi:hypothetical protein